MKIAKATGVRALCVLLLATPATGQEEPDSVTRAPDEEPEPTILGAPAGLGPGTADGSGDLLAVEPGTRLRARPDARAPTVAIVDVRIDLPVLDRLEHWAQVRYGTFKGWIAEAAAVHAPDAAAPSTVATGQLDHAAWRLALARQMLRPGAERKAPKLKATLGPFALATDVEDRRLLRLLSKIAGHLPEAFRDRYGLEPRSATGDTVVLFSREADYRAYEAQVRPETDRGALGHAAHGLAVLYVGRQGPEDVAAVLVHELTHVLSHRLMPAPPPWLDEGLANDLAFCRIDGDRRLELETLGGRSVVIEKHSYRPGGWIGIDQAVYLSGPAASRNLLAERWSSGDTIRIERLAALSGAQFFDPEDRQVRYDASVFFVRYLLDGEDGELAAGFRSFLAALAAGEPWEASGLPTYLGRDWPRLEGGFATWLEAGRP